MNMCECVVTTVLKEEKLGVIEELYLVEDRRHGTRGIWGLSVLRWRGGRCLEIFAAYLPFCRLYSWLEIYWPF